MRSKAFALVPVLIALTLGFLLVGIIYQRSVELSRGGTETLRGEGLTLQALRGISAAESWLLEASSADGAPPRTNLQTTLTDPSAFELHLVARRAGTQEIASLDLSEGGVSVWAKVYALDYRPDPSLPYREGLPPPMEAEEVEEGGSSSMWGSYFGSGSASSKPRRYHYLVRSRASDGRGSKGLERLVQMTFED